MIRFALTALAFAMATALPARAEIDMQEITTPGGIKAWLVEEHSIPFVALEIVFRGGAVLDPEGKEGAMNLMAALLDEGAGDLDARAFAKARDDLASSIGFSAGYDAVSISARFLTETTDDTVALLRSALTEPRFDEDAVERVRAQIQSNLQFEEADPQAIAGREFASFLYGDHPYGRSKEGTAETVAALTREDILAAHQAAFHRDRIYVSAVGDITGDQLGVLLDKLLGDLPEGGPELPGMADPNLPGGVNVVNFDTPQSVVRFAQPGVGRFDEDFFPVFILNHILGGGGFESRLMSEVREKRGLTYGIYTYPDLSAYTQKLAGGTATANDRVAETIEVIRAEWQRIHDEGVTEQELNDAKTYLTGAYPLRFDSNSRIASIAVGMQFDDMPLDYITTRNDQVNAVTLDDVNRVARDILDPDRLTFLVVGQPEGLEAAVE